MRHSRRLCEQQGIHKGWVLRDPIRNMIDILRSYLLLGGLLEHVVKNSACLYSGRNCESPCFDSGQRSLLVVFYSADEDTWACRREQRGRVPSGVPSVRGAVCFDVGKRGGRNVKQAPRWRVAYLLLRPRLSCIKNFPVLGTAVGSSSFWCESLCFRFSSETVVSLVDVPISTARDSYS